MSWLSIFKSKAKAKKFECLTCGKETLREDCVEIAYRYGPGEGSIGKAHMCMRCEKKYNIKDEDDDYVEPV